MSRIILNSIVQNFLFNRNPQGYLDVIDDLFTNYVVSDEYASLPAAERQNVVSCAKELKNLVIKLIPYKQKFSDLQDKSDEEDTPRM